MTKIAIFFLLGGLCWHVHGQNNCPLLIQVTTSDGDCYNNCQIQVNLINPDSSLMDTNTTDLSDFKFYCINLASTDTNFSYQNQFYVEEGIYKVGVQAVCYYSDDIENRYILLDTSTVVTTHSTYITPSLSSLSNIVTDSVSCGIVPTLPCTPTGRAQLHIINGAFPYYVAIYNQDTIPIDTLVFTGPMYSGNQMERYDHREYFSIEGLAKGTYFFHVWDNCAYHMPTTKAIIDTTPAPKVRAMCMYHGTENMVNGDSNVFKYYVELNDFNHYFDNRLSEIIEFRLVYPPFDGVSDTTEWMHLPDQPDQVNNGYYKYNLYDTLHRLSRYCDIFDMPIQMEARSLLCPENYTNSYTPSSTAASKFLQKSQKYYRTSTTYIPASYDTCGSIASQTITRQKIGYTLNFGNYSIIPWGISSCDEHERYYNRYYTYPLYWTILDNNTQQVIKIDTIMSWGNQDVTTTIAPEDIENFYGIDLSDTSITPNIRHILQDNKGCVQLDTVQPFFFYENTSSSGGNQQTYSFRAYKTYSSDGDNYCYEKVRTLVFSTQSSSSSAPMPYSVAGNCIFELIESPENNKYNFTATYNQETQQWTILRDSVSNLADMTFGTTSISFSISDYFLPSGRYVFRLTTPCTTYRASLLASFNTTFHEIIHEQPEYELVTECTEMVVRPVAGSYYSLEHNHYTSGANIGQPYTDTADLAASFTIVSGPIGGYENFSIGLGGELRITRPGTYVIAMSPIRSMCDKPIVYDTLYFSGGTVEFKYSYAYVCDSNSTIGFARVKGKNGTEPYTYRLFSGPNMTGTLLGVNATGVFDNLPIRDGQFISCEIIDSCLASFHINFQVMNLQSAKKCWFEGGLVAKEICEGNFVQVYSLGTDDGVSYFWEGPNGFTAHTSTAQTFIPRGAEGGYFKVTLINTGCLLPISDSILLDVLHSPRVIIAEDALICPGEEVQLFYTAYGEGTVNYTIGHNELNSVTHTQHTGSDTYTYTPSAPATFWVESVSDDLCTYSFPSDTVTIAFRERKQTVCDLVTRPDDICIGESAAVHAHSLKDPPYVIKWYKDEEMGTALQADTITGFSDVSTFNFPQLLKDTLVYVTISDSNYCDATVQNVYKSIVNMQNGSYSIPCGESILFYDSGGKDNPYGDSERLTYTFHSESGYPITFKLNELRLTRTDRIYIYSGPYAQPDSLLGSFAAISTPTPISSRGADLTIKFISTYGGQGWEAVVSVQEKPIAVPVSVTDSVKVQLYSLDPLPVSYGNAVNLRAEATGGRGDLYKFVWEASTDNILWETVSVESSTGVSEYTPTNCTQDFYIRVIVTDTSEYACKDSDTAYMFFNVANIKLQMEVDVTAGKCSAPSIAQISVHNSGGETAEDVVCRIHLPDDFHLSGDASDEIPMGNVAPGETKSIEMAFFSAHSYPAGGSFCVKAQIWSCLQTDSTPTVRYGDWDWERMPLQMDEDTASFQMLPAWRPEDYQLSTVNDTVCYGNDAQLSAVSDLPYPQYFTWYKDPALSEIIQRDTLTNASEKTLYDIKKLRTDQTVYVTVENNETCPPTHSALLLDKSHLPVTDTLLMCNGTTEVNMNSRIKFYDSGGPDGNFQRRERFIHTFHTDVGQIILNISLEYAAFIKIHVYDGPDIQSPLIIEFDRSSNLIISSSTGYLTVLFDTHSTTVSSTGWVGEVFSTETYKTEDAEAYVRAVDPSVSITAQNDTVCYGDTAHLEAFSTIDYPQYITWHDPHTFDVIQNDTLYSGKSVLELPYLVKDDYYIVNISNGETCPKSFAKDTLISDEIMMSTVNMGDTVEMSISEQITLMPRNPNNALQPVQTYTHTFISKQGNFYISFGGSYSSNTVDTLRIFDGPEGGTLLAEFHRGNATTSSIFPSLFSSSNTITVQYVKYQTYNNMSLYLTISVLPMSVADTAYAFIKEPIANFTLISTDDTVCHDQTAQLTATSSLEYPQYYEWWDSSLEHILYQDTVTSGHSLFSPEHQTHDSLYYVHVHNQYSCPLHPEKIHQLPKRLKPDILLNPYFNDTIFVGKRDSIPFYDAGGPYSNSPGFSNKSYNQFFKAEEGYQIVLHFDYFLDFNFRVMTGTTTSSIPYSNTPRDFVSTNGILCFYGPAHNKYTGWSGYITTNYVEDEVLAESEVKVRGEATHEYHSFTLCQNRDFPFVWRDTTFFNSMDPLQEFTFYRTNSLGCDSIVTVNLEVTYPTIYGEHDTICQNDLPYTWRDTTFQIGTTSGRYDFYGTGSNGCDSIVYLFLHVLPSYHLVEYDTICQNDLPYTWRDTTFQIGSTSGQYDFYRTASSGCDSLVDLHLHVLPSYHLVETAIICQNDLPYTWRDTTFQIGSTSGQYDFYRTASSGCDSLVDLHLHVLP
ncbi:MAG: hypothetical protein J5642_03130, partial [Bacteroidales bacterium]|nr:hypothetical protein [Bacteroidales bacterium]